VGNLSVMLATYPLRLLLENLGLVYTITILSTITLAITIATVYVCLRVAVDKGSNTRSQIGFRNIGEIARDPHSWGVSITTVATNEVMLSFQSAWGQLLLSKCFKIDRITTSYYLMILALVFVLVSPITGYISDKLLKKRKPLLLSTLLATVSWTLIYISHLAGSTQLLLLSMIVMGIDVGLHIVASPMIKEVRGPEVAATSTAFLNTVLFLSTALLNTIPPLLNPLHAVVASSIISFTGIIMVELFTRESLRK